MQIGEQNVCESAEVTDAATAVVSTRFGLPEVSGAKQEAARKKMHGRASSVMSLQPS